MKVDCEENCNGGNSFLGSIAIIMMIVTIVVIIIIVITLKVGEVKW